MERSRESLILPAELRRWLDTIEARLDALETPTCPMACRGQACPTACPIGGEQ